QASLGSLLLFVVVVTAVVLGNAIGQRLSAAVVEEMLDGIRRRTADLVRRSDYGRFEAIGGHAIHDSLARNSSTLTEAAVMSIHGVSAFGAMILGGLYTLMLSPLVFAVIFGLMLISTLFYRLTQRQTHGALERASAVRERFYGLLRHLLDGF